MPRSTVAETWTIVLPRGFGRQPEDEKHPQGGCPWGPAYQPRLCPAHRQSSLETSPGQGLEAFLLLRSVLSLKLNRPS